MVLWLAFARIANLVICPGAADEKDVNCDGGALSTVGHYAFSAGPTLSVAKCGRGVGSNHGRSVALIYPQPQVVETAL